VRAVHAELVYRREVMRTPIRTLAAEIGISKSAVDEFHKRLSYPGKIWPKLRDWYMRTHHRMKHEEYQTPPEEHLMSALHVLSTFPREHRAQAMRAMAETHRSLNESIGLPVPEWVGMLSDLAERELRYGPSDEPDLRVLIPRRKEN
jgi:hypothetical protein